MNYAPDEIMTIAAARSLGDGQLCFVGIGLPSAAANLARLLHAPDIVLIYESGTIETRPDILPLSIGDGELCDTALVTVSVPEMFGYWLQGGRIDVGFLGAAQLDRYGNINTTTIGSYDEPKVRLPGGGGAPEIIANAGETIIILRHNPRGLVEELDFVTSLGHGRNGRGVVGRSGRGPTRLITDLCVMEPEPETREFVVTSIHPHVERRQIVEQTGWPVRFAPTCAQTPAPEQRELRVLRDLHERTRLAHGGAV